MENMRSIFGMHQAMNLVRDIWYTEVYEDDQKRTYYIPLEKARTCWCLSKMPIEEPVKNKHLYSQMVFIEFLEFICRLAYIGDFSSVVIAKKSNYQ